MRDVQQAVADRSLEGLHPGDLIGAAVVAAVLRRSITEVAHGVELDPAFPTAVARVGGGRAWLVGDIKKYEQTGTAPKRAEGERQNRLIESAEIAEVMQIHPDYLRTLLSRSRWDRVPRPAGKVGTTHYWWRDDFERWQREQGEPN